MTHEEMRIAIAEACGNDVIQCPFIPNKIRPGQKTVFTREAKEQWHLTYPSGGGIRLIEDYLSDLNAMQAADKYASEHVMDADQWEQYGRELHKIHPTAVVHVHNPPEGIDWYDFATIMTTLTAAQRAEAFCRTLWPERFLTNLAQPKERRRVWVRHSMRAPNKAGDLSD